MQTAANEQAYQKDKQFMLNLIHDLAELQKGKYTVSDAERGRQGFVVELYGQKYEYLFELSSESNSSTVVKIETNPPDSSAQDRIKRMFALMDGFMK